MTATMQVSKKEMRALIRFLHAKEEYPIEIHTELETISDENILSKSWVYPLCNLLKDRRTGLTMNELDVAVCPPTQKKMLNALINS